MVYKNWTKTKQTMARQGPSFSATEDPEERSIEEGVEMLFNEYPGQAENRLLTSDCTPHNPLHSTATESDSPVPGE